MTRKTIFNLLTVSSLVVAASSAAFANQGFIVAPGRADIAFDTSSSVVYISGTDDLRRYDVKAQTFLDPIHLGGRTLGMDISPDGKTLAVANTSYGTSSNFVDLINLQTGASSRINFGLSFYEGGTYSVAFDSGGKLLVSSQFLGSGWTPLRQFDSLTNSTQILGSVRQDTMLSASANRQVIGVAESNISDGRWGYYQAGDPSYVSQHQLYDPITGGTGWFNFEIAVSPDGTQFAIPTYGGTYIGSKYSVLPQIGQYAGVSPIGVAYSPTTGNIFLPLAQTNYVAEYDSDTFEEITRFFTPTGFEWQGNVGFGEGRTKVSSDGDYLFTTVGDGVFYSTLETVPEPATLAELLVALGSLWVVRRRSFK